MAVTFTTWLNQWWQKFDAMDIGTAYEIAKCAKDSELFTDLCKDYIDKSPNGNCYEFSKDMKFFKKFTFAESDLSEGLHYRYVIKKPA